MSIQATFCIQRGEFTLDVNLEIPGQGITALYGPSGCGKTSLLRAIAGLDHYSGSQLKVDEETWQDKHSFLPTYQRPLGFVFQQASLFPHLSVLQNIEYGLKRIPESQRKISLGKAIELLDISSLMKRRPSQLSGGEQQRVSIARAIAVNPRLLLMDEPLSALDDALKQDILPYIESLNRTLNIPVIYVSHSTHEVARLAHHLVLLEAGKVKATGAAQELLTRLDLPLANIEEAETVIKATVAEHDETFGLTYVDFTAGRFSLPRKDLPVGHDVQLHILARDVSLTLEKQTGTSILNIFPATVEQIIARGTTQMTIRLLAGGQPLLARVTRKSASLLDLKPGKKLFAQIKSVAILR